MLKAELGVETRLIPGSRGIFEVRVDGAVVAAKNLDRGFPNPDEIVQAVRGAM